jgi:Fur family ferric uptake transcriptional regulator
MTPGTDVRPFVRIFGRYLREQGLPVTQQREAVAEVVFSTQGHLSVDQIEACLRESGERIGKATVYRTLDLLVRSKLVDEHDFGEGFKRYEHRLSREPVHEHLICIECGKVVEFRSSEIQEVERRVAGEHGFQVVRHSLEVYGICGQCQDAVGEGQAGGLTCPIDIIGE